MSSILKALRRLEDERARKNHVAPEIAASLLRSRSIRRELPLWIWPTVISAVALIVAAFLFWLLIPDNKGRDIFVSTPVSVPVIASSPGKRGEVIIEEVIEQRRPVLLPPANLSHSPPPLPSGTAAPLVAVPAVPVAPAVPAISTEPVTSVAPTLAEKTPPQTVKPIAPALEERRSPVVSAIAWQEDSAARMAVIEGLPMMAGELIGTAKVQEILPDRVLFVDEGVPFVVRLSL